MDNRTLYEKITEYINWLEAEERSIATRIQYNREISDFLEYLGKTELDKEVVLQYKQKLEQEYQPASVNAKLAALNGFFTFIKRKDLNLKYIKIQKKTYCSVDKELTKEEYIRLIHAAEKKKNKKLSLLIQTICGTGIRVSELQFITVEAVNKGEAIVSLKNKTRTILIPGKLRKQLKRYMRTEKIISGAVFVTRTGNPLDRSNIWKMMKELCKDAKVNEKKVFPHNLRHLFARTFYAIDKDIAKLADILGHSNINTTRIYIVTTGQEHCRRMDALGLVV